MSFPVIIAYHKSCRDGWCYAMIAYKYFTENEPDTFIHFLQIKMTTPSPTSFRYFLLMEYTTEGILQYFLTRAEPEVQRVRDFIELIPPATHYSLTWFDPDCALFLFPSGKGFYRAFISTDILEDDDDLTPFSAIYREPNEPENDMEYFDTLHDLCHYLWGDLSILASN